MDWLFYFGLSAIILGFIVWSWFKGIDEMFEKHPDYKGEDMFDDPVIRKENWDDNKQHTEQHFKL